MNMTSKMRACCRTQKQLAIGRSIGGDLLQTFAHDCALAWLEMIPGVEFSWPHELRVVLRGRQVLADEGSGRLQGLSRGIVHILPGRFPFEDEVADEDARDGAVRDALAGIACGNEVRLSPGLKPMNAQ